MEKKYEHLLHEKANQEKWITENTYGLKDANTPLFSIDTPPPTVSGTLHIGHIFSYTQTDVLARYKRMNGYSVFYPFGFDDNGLPTERYVEKKHAVRGHEMSRSDFIALCTEESQLSAQQFTSLWQRMGLSADWKLTYSTISNQARKISQQSFIELFKKGYIYRTQEPALYCTTCRTSVAQAELDDLMMPSFFNDIIFKDSDGNDLIIATTRPELLPACVAVLYNPNDFRYKKLHGKKAIVPLFGHEVPIIADDLVEIDKGTGLVMVCTFGDKTDIIWYKKHNLSYKQIINLNGKCTENAGFLQGLKVTDARTTIIQRLKEHNLLINQKSIVHSVNVHERCKKEIEYLILPQWFISILPYKQKFLQIADSIQWYPTFMKNRYNDWVENLAWDWGISRQRFYGIPFPAWHCQNCGHILLAELNQLPVDPQETPYNGSCPQCKNTTILPDSDVMDTWNTSSLTPYLCYDLYTKAHNKTTSNSFDEALNNKFLPMSIRPQAHDIIRTWAFDTIVKTWMHNTDIPWNNIIISGHVLSDKKEKISKKDANGLDPEQLLLKYPADAIRYWTALGKLGQDISFSEEQILVGQKLITKLWNAFRFAHPHLEHFTTPEKLPNQLGTINQWILHIISRVYEKYCSYFEQQEPGLALQVVEQFFWNDFCDNYIELVKNQLFNPDEYPKEEVYATKWTLYHIGLRILQLYAPYIPHITETIYCELYCKNEKINSIHITNLSAIQKPYIFSDQAEIISHIITLISHVRKLKSEYQLSLKTPLETLHVYTTNDELIQTLPLHTQLIRGITHANTITYSVPTENSVRDLKQVNDLWQAYIIME